MRVAVAVAAALIAAALAALFLVTREEDDAYRVRAIFDNAGFIIPGEDVKVAGVKVGSIEAVEVTPDFKAAIVLRIDDEGYQDFRADASCIVRPQSLIGERFVECDPTRTRGVGAEAPGALRLIDEGPGEGQYLLPVSNTSKSVDLDLLNNVMREPYRERLAIIISELGIGLAGRGDDLNEVIRRSNPALKEIDDVLALLARQNEQLVQLAVDSDRIMAPLARDRQQVASSIENMSEVAGATAERRGDLAASIERLPPFLRELRPTMIRLGELADEMIPVVSDVGDVAPDINRFVLELGPFSQAGIPAVDSLGETGKTGKPAVEGSLPLIRDVQTLAKDAKPVADTLAKLLVSFQSQDGIQSLMEYIFFQATAVNGFDSFGHYLRAGLIVNQCSTYSVRPLGGCSSNFVPSASATSADEDAAPRDAVLAWTQRVLQGLDPGTAEGSAQAGGGAGLPAAAPAPSPEPTPVPAAGPAPATTPAPEPPAAGGDAAGEPLLDYLFGGDQ